MKSILRHLVLSTIVGLLYTSCAPPTTLTIPEPKKLSVTSEPSEATIYLYNANTQSERMLGITPLSISINPDITNQYLIARLEGYDDRKKYLLKDELIIHFKLENLFKQIFLEGKSKGYSKEFKNDVLEILGLCEETLNSPRMLSGTYASQADTKLSQLLVNHPYCRGYFIIEKLNLCTVKLRILTTMPTLLQGQPIERETVNEIEYYVRFIKSPLMILE